MNNNLLCIKCFNPFSHQPPDQADRIRKNKSNIYRKNKTYKKQFFPNSTTFLFPNFLIFQFVTKNSTFDKKFHFDTKTDFLTKKYIFGKKFDLSQKILFLTQNYFFLF